MLQRALAFLLLLPALLLACPTTVVLPDGSGTSTSSQSGQGGTVSHGGGCGVDLVGDLENCPDDPGDDPCSSLTLCDTGGHAWTATCTGSGCSCQRDGLELCACDYPTLVCAGPDCCPLKYVEPCCPFPWLGHPGCLPVGAACTLNAECCNYLCFEGQCEP